MATFKIITLNLKSMKKKLLFLACALFVSMSSINAQNYEWIFGNDVTNFPVAAGYSDEITINNLVITPGDGVANMAQIDGSKKTFGDRTYINRFKFNGAGYAGAKVTDEVPSVFMPIQRYVSFAVNGKATIKAQAITGSTGTARRIFVTDGEKLIGTIVMDGTSDINEYTVEYDGPAATLYLFCNQAINLYNLKVDGNGETSINNTEVDKGIVIAVEYYNLIGQKVNDATEGILIKKEVYENGLVETSKIINQL